MPFCTDPHYIHESYNKFYSLSNFLRAWSILLTITNNSISTKRHPKYSLFISAVITKAPSDKGGQLIVVRNTENYCNPTGLR